MIQKDKTHFIEILKGVLIFRDNIEEIIDGLKKYMSTIELHDENYLYENIDDLIKQKGIHPKKLKIEAKNKTPYESVSLDFYGKSVNISCYGSKNMYALGFELKDYLKSKRPWYFRFFNFWFFLGVLIGSIPLLNTINNEKKSSTAFIWVLGLFGTLVVLLLISLFINFMTHGLNLIRKHEHGFWKRNRDKILLAIIASIFGVLGTLLIQWLTKK